MNQWYALRVRSNFENSVHASLCSRDVESFLPIYQKVSRWSDRLKQVKRPLFPGYVFARFDASKRLPILTVPGMVQILGNSCGPIAVEDDEIQSIRLSVESGRIVLPWPYLNAGDRVRIEYGALAGVSGVLIRIKGELRVVVSVSLLQRSIAVEVDRDCVTLVEPASRAASALESRRSFAIL